MPAIINYQVIREGEETILLIDYESVLRIPSIEDDALCMSTVIDKLIEVKNVTRIIFTQKRDYEYDYSQTQLLVEIAKLYNQLVKQRRIFTFASVISDVIFRRHIASRYADLQRLVFATLKRDPIGAYVELKRLLRHEKLNLESSATEEVVVAERRFISLINYLLAALEKTRLITLAKPYLAGFKPGDRTIYRMLFTPTIKPDFMFTKLMSSYPTNGIELDTYTVNGTEVTIFSFPDSVKFLYHMLPPEFKLSEEEYEILDATRTIMAEHKPKKEEFVDPERMREVFYNIGHDLIEELAEHQGLKFSQAKINKLTKILVRYTVGFGLIEVLLADEKIQDVSINSPYGLIPMFIVHQDYGDCYTNIIPTVQESESWASKLRMISGRPLDEANQILDTEIHLPGATARVSAITAPLDPTGLAFSFRRHRDKPWTLPLFIKVKMISPLAAGLISFCVDGTRSFLVSGTRSSGKTSFLGSLLVEIMRRYRILTIEDSVTGDCNIVTSTNGVINIDSVENCFNQLSKIKPVIKKNNREIIKNPKLKIFSVNSNGKVVLVKASHLIRHLVNKNIYEATTATGRIIKVTGDHSLFGISKEHITEEVKVKNLKKDNFIATPRIIPFKNKEKKFYNAAEKILKERSEDKIFVKGKFSKIKANKIGLKFGYSKSAIKSWVKKSFLPLNIARKLDIKIEQFKIKGNSKYVPVKIKLDKYFLNFIGLWIADGCYDKNSIIFSVSSNEERQLVKKIANRFGFKTKNHSDGFSLMINSKSFKKLAHDYLLLKGNAYTKKIPSWVFNLSKKQIGYVLQGIFSGDGCASDKEIIISLASMNLLKTLQLALSCFGIIFRINILRKRKTKSNDRTKDGRISALTSLKIFEKKIGFLQKDKNRKLRLLAAKVSTHDSTDIVPLPYPIRYKLKKLLPERVFCSHDYIKRKNEIGINKLRRILNYLKINHKKEKKLINYLNKLTNNDIYWDKIVKIKRSKRKQYVYDFSVPKNENFVCENIIAHNTLELPVPPLRKLGYNIQQMKVASALAGKETAELSATAGIRSTLRLGDSAIFVGEVRSREAVALYEAMRVGAAANVVAGTIHADSPYGVFDRVVNDIGVPKTSFKATDIIIIAAPIRTPGGIKRVRRVTQITEVRKAWEEDPLAEKGFVDLLKYDVTTDSLQPTPELINGDSEILKLIAANVKGLAGSWDAVWDSIQLRTKIRQALVDYSIKTKNPSLLEADFAITSNDVFHNIVDKVQEEIGGFDSKRIYFEWEDWLKRECKRKGVK